MMGAKDTVARPAALEARDCEDPSLFETPSKTLLEACVNCFAASASSFKSSTDAVDRSEMMAWWGAESSRIVVTTLRIVVMRLLALCRHASHGIASSDVVIKQLEVGEDPMSGIPTGLVPGEVGESAAGCAVSPATVAAAAVAAAAAEPNEAVLLEAGGRL
mmetsp:Transcript_90850/g.189941  ORF Transcript_90850/g.189941 Transcript_90850/m.189941 type:complete len:161 (+) Transcript_90850:946-1428(+)